MDAVLAGYGEEAVRKWRLTVNIPETSSKQQNGQKIPFPVNDQIYKQIDNIDGLLLLRYSQLFMFFHTLCNR